MDQNPALNPLLSEGDSGLTLEELSSESSPDTSKYSTDLCCPFTALTRRLDFTWGNILCLGLVSGVLLALVLIMAEAGYCWKETPGEPGSSHAEMKISWGKSPIFLEGSTGQKSHSPFPQEIPASGNLTFIPWCSNSWTLGSKLSTPGTKHTSPCVTS
ncbi:unnamed protein product [Lepidochelys olivacea]